MAKRKTLVAPTVEDLARLETEFRRETPAKGGGLVAPISHIAADSAAAHDPRSASDRAAAARDKADAERMRQAEDKGLVIRELPLEDIEADAMVRDRMSLNAEEMDELQASIAAHGLRLPVEVFEFAVAGQGGAGQNGARYGLLSGYRRLRAVQSLRGLTGQEKYATIRAIVRDPNVMGGAFAAMIEENEIRSSLSHFERGRIAVIAAQQGAFANVEASVEALFQRASKAKRSKIRSFALIFEELGDMLAFPEALREKDGLRLATGLRDGAERALREALAAETPDSAADEWARIEAALAGLEPNPRRLERGGRPSTPAGKGRVAQLATGVKLTSGHDGKAWFIRLDGTRVDQDLVETAMRELERLLGPA